MLWIHKGQFKYWFIFVVVITGGVVGLLSLKRSVLENSSAQTSQASIKASLSQRRRALPPGLMCFNVNALRVQQWSDPRFTDAVQSLSPKVLRLPGGQGSNYWDWRRGGLIPDWQGLPDGLPFFLKSARDRQYTAGSLENFLSISDTTDTTPLFVLNMLSSTLESQIQMLKQAEALGIPIQEIELGNEFYFGTRNNRAVFPTPTDYAQTAVQWIAKIKKEFPQAKISVMGVSDQGRSGYRLEQRRLNWNRFVFPVTLDSADAVTLHVYPDPELGPTTQAMQRDYPRFSELDIPIILGEPFRHWHAIQKTDGFGTLPRDKKIWITEYNLHERLRQRKVRQNRVPGSWAHGLFNLAMGLQFLEDPRVEKLCNHMLVGDSQFSAIYDSNKSFSKFADSSIPTTSFGLSATGVALQPWGQAMSQASEARKIEFTNVPTLRGKQQFQYPALYGWSFANQQEEQQAIIMNLSSRPLQVDLSSIFPSGMAYRQVEGNPRTLVTASNSLKETTGRIPATFLSIPAYSISHLKPRE